MPCPKETQEVYDESRRASRVRVSTQRQAQIQTIEQQLERLRAHLQSQGWELAEENIFRDDGYSGSNLNRPAWIGCAIRLRRPRLIGWS